LLNKKYLKLVKRNLSIPAVAQKAMRSQPFNERDLRGLKFLDIEIHIHPPIVRIKQDELRIQFSTKSLPEWWHFVSQPAMADKSSAIWTKKCRQITTVGQWTFSVPVNSFFRSGQGGDGA
jgi:hypothetical protein